MADIVSLTNDQIISILLKEYDTLRAEILMRSTQRVSFLGLFGASMAYFLYKYKELRRWQKIVTIFGIIFLGGVWFQLGNVIYSCSTRIVAIEQRINTIAGSTLLEWETMNRSSTFNRFYGYITNQERK